ncbi:MULTISPECIES: hypothetical protein [Cyanophyceae]|uniref:hypothetical protein n=1 Tax=Cyanophyceae TaxID=3028117 RepID=UPI0016872829|nr:MULTISPECIES: hypothetical protein [unclassified Trichocoleus]MBD2063729.1 hypothetical protein [Trichocoleus sp. FACHB-6]
MPALIALLVGRDDGKEKVLMDVVADENVLTNGVFPELTELAELLNTAAGAFTFAAVAELLLLNTAAGAALGLVNTGAGAGAFTLAPPGLVNTGAFTLAPPGLVNTGAGTGAGEVVPEFGDTGAGAVAVALVVGGALVVAVAVALALLEVAPGVNVA